MSAAGYTAVQATFYALLLLPGHFYEVAPIAVLIGTIYTLSRMAQSSEYTILRTGGLGPARALSLLATLGLVFGVLTFVVGDYMAPLSEREAAELRSTYKGGLRLGRSGAWLKGPPERRERRAQLLDQRRRRGPRADPAACHPHLRIRRRQPAAAPRLGRVRERPG